MLKPVQHVALIPDGSGRWATALGKSRLFGHKAGAEVFYHIIKAAMKLGVRHLTIFGLSCDNLSRPKAEVSNILSLCLHYLDKHLEELNLEGVKVVFIGNREALSIDVQKAVKTAEEKTSANSKFILTIALSFSGTWQLIDAIKCLCEEGRVDELRIMQKFQNLLPSEPDILIRTGGEKRLSDFIMFHLRYTELFFLDMMWPDFSSIAFQEVLSQYALRERRFGQVGVEK